MGKQLHLPELIPSKMRKVILFNDIIVFAKVMDKGAQKIITMGTPQDKGKRPLFRGGSVMGLKKKDDDDSNSNGSSGFKVGGRKGSYRNKEPKEAIKSVEGVGGAAGGGSGGEEVEEEEYQYLFQLDVLHCQVEQGILSKDLDENTFVLIHPEGLLALTVMSVSEKEEWLDVLEKAIKNRLLAEQNRESMFGDKSGVLTTRQSISPQSSTFRG